MSDETPLRGPDDEGSSGTGVRGDAPGGEATPKSGAGRAWAGTLGSRRRKALVAGAAALAVLVAVSIGLAVVGGDGDVIDGEMAAARVADPVPLGPVITDLPYNCGLSYATVDRLTGGPDREHSMNPDSEECTWETGVAAYAGTGGPNRELSVRLYMGTGEPRSMASAEFIRELDSESRPSGSKPGPIRRLAGIGDAAVIWDQVDLHGALYPGETKPREVTSRTTRTTILFRRGNVVATVAYAGADYSPKNQDKVIPELEEKLLSPKTTQGAALYAARDVLTHLGGRPDGTPHVIEPRKRPKVTAPKACALVPPSVLKRLGDARLGSIGGDQEESYLIDDDHREDIVGDACSWDGGSLNLEAEILSAKDSRLGPGSEVAGREYVSMFFHQREREVGEDGDEPGERIIGSLKGLGDRAFFVYARDSSRSGEVYFQRSNVLVRVRCWSIDEPSKNEVLDCAYRAAREADRHVRG